MAFEEMFSSPEVLALGQSGMHTPAPSMSSAMKSPEPWSPSPGGNRGDSKNKEEDHYDPEPIP
jgi:hypothetical protein